MGDKRSSYIRSIGLWHEPRCPNFIIFFFFQFWLLVGTTFTKNKKTRMKIHRTDTKIKITALLVQLAPV